MFIYDELSRRKIEDNSVDLHKMTHFAMHTSNPFGLVVAMGFQVLSDSLNNIARQTRPKRRENLEFIACAEG